MLLAVALLAGCQHAPPRSLCHSELTYALLDDGTVVLENPDPSVLAAAPGAEARSGFLFVRPSDPDRQRVLAAIIAIYPDFMDRREIRIRTYGECPRPARHQRTR